MDIHVIFPLVSAIASLSLAFAAYAKRRLDAVNRAFAALSLFIVFWSSAITLFYVFSDEHQLFFAAKSVYFLGGLIASAFFYFAVVFASGVFASQIWWSAIIIPQSVLFVLYYFSDWLIWGYVAQNGMRGFLFGPAIGIFYFHFFLFFGFGLVILARMRKNADTALRKKLRSILFGSIIGVTGAGWTNILMPLFGDASLVWLGPFLVIIWPLSIAYGIRKHRLFNVRIITAEILIFALWVISLTRLFLSVTVFEIWLNVGIFLALVLLGVFLARSVNQEIYHRKRAEKLTRNLTAANAELRKLDEAKSEFISIASHQLRTPLSILRGYLSLLDEGSYGIIPHVQRDVHEKMRLVTGRLINLVNDLLNLSRIESGKMQYNLGAVDVLKLVTDACEEFREKMRQKNLLLEYRPPQDDAMIIHADAEKIHEVIDNLFDNAVKYTVSGGSIRVMLAKLPEREAVRLSVCDTGVGIAPEDLPLLFRKFSRNEETRKINTEGLGLGLYFAKRVIEDHHGRIWAESGGKGKGSTFFIELPILQP